MTTDDQAKTTKTAKAKPAEPAAAPAKPERPVGTAVDVELKAGQPMPLPLSEVERMAAAGHQACIAALSD